MQEFTKKLKNTDAIADIPQFLSCSSFDSSAEYIIHTQEPRLVFEVMDSGDKDDPMTRLIEHENGDHDYVTIVDCYSEAFFNDMTPEQATEEIEHVMDELEGWYISEILDLDSYEAD